jgi:hypothetical protein
MVSTVIEEGSGVILDEAIDQVVQLIAYAFVCANDVLTLVRKVPGAPKSIQEPDQGDEEVEELFMLFMTQQTF